MKPDSTHEASVSTPRCVQLISARICSSSRLSRDTRFRARATSDLSRSGSYLVLTLLELEHTAMHKKLNWFLTHVNLTSSCLHSHFSFPDLMCKKHGHTYWIWVTNQHQETILCAEQILQNYNADTAKTNSNAIHFHTHFQTSLMIYLQLVLDVLSVVSALWRWLYSSWAKYSLCCFTSYISFFACNKENILLQPLQSEKTEGTQCVQQLYDE
jgi:hypothetical protein